VLRGGGGPLRAPGVPAAPTHAARRAVQGASEPDEGAVAVDRWTGTRAEEDNAGAVSRL